MHTDTFLRMLSELVRRTLSCCSCTSVMQSYAISGFRDASQSLSARDSCFTAPACRHKPSCCSNSAASNRNLWVYSLNNTAWMQLCCCVHLQASCLHELLLQRDSTASQPQTDPAFCHRGIRKHSALIAVCQMLDGTRVTHKAHAPDVSPAKVESVQVSETPCYAVLQCDAGPLKSKNGVSTDF